MPPMPGKLGGTPKPDLRLAITNDGMPSKQNRYPAALGERIAEQGSTETPTISLAHVPGMQGDNTLLGQRGVKALPRDDWPALLVSYYYLDAFLENQKRYCYRNWMMDSGAFSAYNAGTVIDIDKYIECCHTLRKNDPTLTEIIGLDVIGSGEESLKNLIYMREQGVVDAIPVFHIGDDWELLKEYCRCWDKVGLSCRFGEPLTMSYKFYDQCFARAWPKRFHSFGWADEKVLMKYPFHSSDSSSWELQPCAFGHYKYFGNLPIRGSTQNLRTQVLWYLELEKTIQQKWRKEMKVLEGLVPVTTTTTTTSQVPVPSINLVVGTGRSIKDVGIDAINSTQGKGEESSKGKGEGGVPTIKLVVDTHGTGNQRMIDTFKKGKGEGE